MSVPFNSGQIRHNLHFRIVTETVSIEGLIVSGHRRLGDVLNSESKTITIRDVTVQCHVESPKAKKQASFADVNIQTILFVLPLEEAFLDDQPKDPMVWVKKRPEKVRIGIGPYEIVGDYYLAEAAVLEGALSVGVNRFLAFTHATIRRPDDPLYAENVKVVLINRQAIDYFMPA
jgi:hypothetical protein